VHVSAQTDHQGTNTIVSQHSNTINIPTRPSAHQHDHQHNTHINVPTSSAEDDHQRTNTIINAPTRSSAHQHDHQHSNTIIITPTRPSAHQHDHQHNTRINVLTHHQRVNTTVSRRRSPTHRHARQRTNTSSAHQDDH
jgi:hypothetical protein